MTTEEKRDKLILANAALKTAVIFIEQAIGTEAAMKITTEMPMLNAISAITREITKIS